MTRRSTVLNPTAPVATAGALALGLTLAGSPAAAVAGPLGEWGEWFGLAGGPQAEAAEGTVAPPTATAGAGDESAAALRERLAAAERRVAELEAELEKTRAQAAWLGDELEASWRWIEELNAVLADERPAADREPVETATAALEQEVPAAEGAGRAPAETAAAVPDDQELAAAGAEGAPVETEAAAPEAADDRGRPGAADGDGIAARLARALDDRRRGAGNADDGGIAARLARTLDALGSGRSQPVAPGSDDLRTANPQEQDGPPAAAATRPPPPPPPPPQQQQGRDAPHYAATQAVNLRAEPTTSARVLAVVEADDTVRLLDRERGWLRVRYTTPSSREVTGWVYGEFLREVEPAEALAVLAPQA